MPGREIIECTNSTVSVPGRSAVPGHADYVQRFARPELLLGHNPIDNKKDSDDEADGDAKMEDGDESEGAFLSDSDDEDS